jgi:thiol-disulfide isomerase/thioredoxin
MKQLMLVLCGVCFTLLTYGQQVKVVANYNNINTIQQMLSPFKGKPVFVDLWATWCYACLDEFKFNNQLDSCLDKQHIVRLYVSFDKDDLDSAWNNNIRSLNLYGYHLRANTALLNQLTTLIWGAPGGFSIPRYLLFGKDGKLLSKNALPPSSTKGLYSQLRTLLK